MNGGRGVDLAAEIRSDTMKAEENLVKRLQAKDQMAANTLVEQYANRLLGVATLVLGDRHLAEDAVQDTLFQAITHIQQFRGDSSLYSWLYTILIRICRARQRKKFWKLPLFRKEESWDQLVDPNEDVIEQTVKLDRQQHVRQAVGALSPHYREVIALFYFEELSLEEIGRIIMKPVGTIKSTLHRARKKLAEILAEEGME